MQADPLHVAASHWSSHALKAKVARIRWPESNFLVRCINQRVCGEAVGGASRGLHVNLKKLLGGRTIPTAVSVGSGRGAKEMALIQAGIVEEFYLYEISEVFIEQGLKLACERGVSSKVHFCNANAFSEVAGGSVDMVHWNSSLHHMWIAADAVKWSRDVLRPGGIFYMDEYVGPNRFQWTESSLRIANEVRAALPAKFFKSPYDESRVIARQVQRPTPERVAEVDPTEAVDSEAIIPAVKSQFPDADIKLTGGAIFRLALNEIIHNIDEKEDLSILSMISIIDQICCDSGDFHFATALAIK